MRSKAVSLMVVTMLLAACAREQTNSDGNGPGNADGAGGRQDPATAPAVGGQPSPGATDSASAPPPPPAQQ